jgi:hypothetical protein
MSAVLEIIQVNEEAEPSFKVWIRRTVMVPSRDQHEGPATFEFEHRRELLAPAASAPPPRNWPIPADEQSNLAEALPWYLEVDPIV